MANFTWISSFPKSGNTWLRFICAAMLADISKDSTAVRKAIPDIHESGDVLGLQHDGSHVAKTHFLVSSLPPVMHSHKAIYVVRNPLDVAVSTVDYMHAEEGEERSRMLDAFCDIGCVQHWRDIGYGAWDEHVREWAMKKQDFPILVLRYEDMLQDSPGAVSEIASFLDLPIDEKRAQWISDVTSFDSMRKTEDSEANKDATETFFAKEHSFGKADFKFMRAGKAGRYAEILSEKQIDMMCDRLGKEMRHFGYIE